MRIGYATDRGVECYERLKGKGPTGAAYVIPLSTGVTFALTEKAPIDKIPIITMGYGRSESRDGSVFQWNFPLLGTYWTAADIILQHIAKKEGGFDKLKGKKIALVYHDSPYGKEPIALLQKRAQMHGFEPMLLPVTHPGVEQKATWLQIRQNRPDYVLLWGWGVMNSTAIKEAVAVGYPREKMYGVWWSGAEQDVRPAEDGAKGYNSVTLQHTSGQFKLHEDLKKYVYDKGQGTAKWEETGEILYVRGLIDAMLGVEAIRTAQEKFGKKPLTGEQVRWGLENLDLTADRIKELGFEGVLQPIKVSCADHEGRAHRPHPDLGRQELEDHVRLVHQRRQRDRARWSRTRRPSTRPRRRSRRAAWRPTDAGPGRPQSQRGGGDRAASVCERKPVGRTGGVRADPVGQQYRGGLRPRHPGAQGRVARGAQGRDRGAARRQRRRQVDDAQGDLQPAVGRARRGHQGLDRASTATRCTRSPPTSWCGAAASR